MMPPSAPPSPPRDVITGAVTTLAGRKLVASATGVVASGRGGFGDGAGGSAMFNVPSSVAIDPSGAFALVTDEYNNRIRRVEIATGATTTLAGSILGFRNGAGGSAKFNRPAGVAIDPSGVFALVTDYLNHRIRRVEIATRVVTTLAGSGTAGFGNGAGSSAKFNWPRGVAIDPSGAFALVADSVNHRIRRVEIATRVVTTLAGSILGFRNGAGSSAMFNNPFGVTIDPSGAFALVADRGGQRIRRVEIATRVVTTLAGSGSVGFANGAGSSAKFNNPCGVAIDPSGAFALVADIYNHRIRRVEIATRVVTTLAGNGSTGANADSSAVFSVPFGVTIDKSGAFALVTDYHRILRVE